MGLTGIGIGMAPDIGADIPPPNWLMAAIAICIKRDSIGRQGVGVSRERCQI